MLDTEPRSRPRQALAELYEGKKRLVREEASCAALKPLRGSLIARSGTEPDSLFWLGRPVADLDPPLVAGPFGPPACAIEAGRLATFVLVQCA